MESIEVYKSCLGCAGCDAVSRAIPACISEFTRIHPGGLRWENTRGREDSAFQPRQRRSSPRRRLIGESPGEPFRRLLHLRLFGFLFHVPSSAVPARPTILRLASRSFYAPTTHEKTCVNGGRESVVTTQVYFSLAQDPLKISQRPRRDRGRSQTSALGLEKTEKVREGSFEFSCLRRFNKLRKLRAHFRGQLNGGSFTAASK